MAEPQVEAEEDMHVLSPVVLCGFSSRSGQRLSLAEAQPIALPPKVFAVLQYLVRHPNRLVTTEELLDAVWPETAVTDAVVRGAMRTLRMAIHSIGRSV